MWAKTTRGAATSYLSALHFCAWSPWATIAVHVDNALLYCGLAWGFPQDVLAIAPSYDALAIIVNIGQALQAAAKHYLQFKSTWHIAGVSTVYAARMYKAIRR